MAVTIDFKNVVDVLTHAGYKAIQEEVGKAIVMGTVFTAGFASVTCSHVALPNGCLTFESPTSLTSLSKNLHNKMVITPFVTGLHKFLVEVNQIVAESGKVVFKDNLKSATEQLKEDVKDTSFIEKVKAMPSDIEENNFFGAALAKEGSESKTVGFSVTKPKGGASSLFVDAGKMPIDVFSDEMVKLTMADKLLQPVFGTSKNSTYYYIGMGLTSLGGTVKIALRLRQPSDDQLVASIRLEGTGVKDITAEIKEQGFVSSDNHASMHYTLDNLGMMRSLVAILYTLPIQLHQTAKIY